MELSKVVIEGFLKKPIQEMLRREGVPFESQDGTLLLLEKLISSRISEDERPVRLEGLRQAQFIRTKVHSHSTGSEADEVARGAMKEHGTYRGHFEWVCGQIADELEIVSDVAPDNLSGSPDLCLSRHRAAGEGLTCRDKQGKLFGFVPCWAFVH